MQFGVLCSGSYVSICADSPDVPKATATDKTKGSAPASETRADAGGGRALCVAALRIASVRR